MSYLRNNVSEKEYNTLYAGYVFQNESPIRDQLSKWFISLNDYPYSKYPPFVLTGFVFLSNKSLKLFYLASKMVEVFKFDDVYIGILAYKLNIKPIHIDSIYLYTPSYYPNFFADKVIAAHHFKSDYIMYIWRQLQSLIKFKPTSYEEFFLKSLL